MPFQTDISWAIAVPCDSYMGLSLQTMPLGDLLNELTLITNAYTDCVRRCNNHIIGMNIRKGAAMAQLTVNGMRLERNNEPFFWLADTIWTAFTNVSDDEWLAYLDRRAAQGFNVLQINALPQWDRSQAGFERYPYATTDKGSTFDFTHPNEEFWAHARWQLAEACKRGFIPALVVQWSNYAPGTWASRLISDNIIPDELVEPVVQKIIAEFDEFEPVWIISGDADFDTPASTARFAQVADLVARLSPSRLKCFHIKGRYDGLPEELAERADFYLYQSGHNITAQNGAYTLAQSFRARPIPRPVINSEPCYEQIGYSHMLYGRFKRADCRRALWLSLTGGASAGITYGAHGVWNWHHTDLGGSLALGEGFLEAMDVTKALGFPGAHDFSFAAQLVDRLSLHELTSHNELLATHQNDMYAALTPDEQTLVVYVPVNADAALSGCWVAAHGFDLCERTGFSLITTYDADTDVTHIRQSEYAEDALYILQPASAC